MQKVLTAAQAREVDRLTTERFGIPSIILMENAAHAVARVIAEKLGGSVKGKSILILCGKGNNGGDGAALARILWTLGAYVEPYLFGSIDQSNGDARINFDSLNKLGRSSVSLEEVYEIESFYASKEAFADTVGFYDVVVDSLFGTGLSRPIERIVKSVIEDENEYFATGSPPTIRVSVDVPSGLDCDKPELIGPTFQSEITVAFTAPKPANILPPASRFNGELTIVDIGSPQELIDEQPSDLYLAEKSDAASWLKQTAFSDDSYKNKRGHALLIAGSDNYSGAAVLVGNAAMRSGVGLVTLAAPKSAKAEIASRLLPDVILAGIDIGDPLLSEFLSNADAIAVGCGLDANDAYIELLVKHIVDTREVPVIVDAGALWFFNSNKVAGWTPALLPPLILTPHEGEFLRLLGTDDNDAIKDRVAAVRGFSQKHNVILVLKGERVVIGEPGGKVVVNPTGNSGLGKAGNGDTLTGILAGFAAQAAKMNIDIFETVVAAVYIAGMAGDIAEKKYGKRVMTATDVRECLAEVFAQFERTSSADGGL